MALPWVRLDTAFPTNPKVLQLAEDKKWQAITVYVAGLAYSGAQGTDGFLPSTCLPFLHGTRRTASDLVSVGLWKGCPGGWDINGWIEFQPTSNEHEERRRKAKVAAEIRWAKAREAGGDK
jgi:hypothetical protein